MPNYRRTRISGGSYFLTIMIYKRKPLFNHSKNISILKKTLSTMRQEFPVKIIAGVILPDHLHMLWEMPAGNSDYSKRVGRMKALFTKTIMGDQALKGKIPLSRERHRERTIWATPIPGAFDT